MPNTSFPKIYFNTPIFLRQILPAGTPAFDFQVEEQNSQAFIRFGLDDGIFRSPFKATFGGFEGLGEVSPSLLQNLFQQIKKKAKELGCTQITITQSPNCYLSESQQAVLQQAYLEAGFQIAYTDTNFHIPVTSTPYIESLQPRTAQRVRQQLKLGYEVVQVEQANLTWFYEQIAHNRHSKGRPLNQSLAAFEYAFAQNPAQYAIFSVLNIEKECLAFSICTLLGTSLYTFYTVNLAEGKSLNPLYLLHNHLNGFCLQQEIPLLDLGIATDKGIDNKGLINFKTQLKAIPSKKITWINHLS